MRVAGAADGFSPIRVVQVNYVFDETLTDPDALLAAYTTLTGWSEALVAAGAERVAVIQRFCRDARVTRNGIDYIFCRDQGGAHPAPWTRSRRLHHAVADAEPDIVHVNGLIFPLQTWFLRRVLPRRSALVLQDHGSTEPAAKANRLVGLHLPRSLRRRGLEHADGFLFSAAGQEASWRAAGFIAPNQRVYHVMEASTGLRPMAKAAARQMSGMAGAPAVLWVGRLNANKDPLTVLDGFEVSLALLPNATLTMIYGADDLLPAVQERLRASAVLRKCVRLVGRVPHHAMPTFYSAADVFVLGSHHEGSGYALLEALACGLTPVVTDIPPFRVMTEGGSLGALWAPGDAFSFAQALVEVGECPVACSRHRIFEHFDQALSWPAVGAHAMNVYREVLNRRRAAAAHSDTE
jgi:glycosyltransferase involved in cell wall biosynthesis